jgi:hypothetical protein
MRVAMRVGTVILLTVAFAGVADATTMLPLDLKGLSERAERVVVATVEESTSAWTPDHSAIYTEVALRVVRPVKGGDKPLDRLLVRREGGTVDGIGMRVHGAAQFEPGEEVLVFLERRGAATYVVGMAQGKLPISTRSDGKKVIGAHHPDVAYTAQPPPTLQGRALSDVEREIKSYGNRSAR